MMEDEESPSERAIAKWTEAHWEGHGVNLERVQRIYLGIDSEPMDFSEETIASMLVGIARRGDPDDAFTIFAIVEALRGNDDHHRLVLRQKKPGKWENPTQHEARFNLNMSLLYSLGNMERAGIKTEAAVATLSEDFGLSRAAVFAKIGEAEKFLEMCKGLGNPEEAAGDRLSHLDNPRPANKRNT